MSDINNTPGCSDKIAKARSNMMTIYGPAKAIEKLSLSEFRDQETDHAYQSTSEAISKLAYEADDLLDELMMGVKA